jgi:hypothetical protein
VFSRGSKGTADREREMIITLERRIGSVYVVISVEANEQVDGTAELLKRCIYAAEIAIEGLAKEHWQQFINEHEDLLRG